MVPANLHEAVQLAEIMLQSGIVPGGLETPQKLALALAIGQEVGFGPAASMNSIMVVNGKPSIYGDGVLALLHGSGLLTAYEDNDHEVAEKVENQDASAASIVKLWRKGQERPYVGRFSVTDAKSAGLWGKAGPWKKYPRRMLWRRAMNEAVVKGFPDLMNGITPAYTEPGPSTAIDAQFEVTQGEVIEQPIPAAEFTVTPDPAQTAPAPAPAASPEVDPFASTDPFVQSVMETFGGEVVVPAEAPDLGAAESYETFKAECGKRGFTPGGAMEWLRSRAFPREEIEGCGNVGDLWSSITGKERGAAILALQQAT